VILLANGEKLGLRNNRSQNNKQYPVFTGFCCFRLCKISINIKNTFFLNHLHNQHNQF